MVAHGCEQILRLPRHETCASCHGAGGDRERCPACGGQGSVQLQQGFFRISRTCDRCGGQGQSEGPVSGGQAALGAKVEVPSIDGRTEIEIKPGTQSGDVLRLRGQGLPRLGGGPRGDQLVRIFVEVPTRLSDEQRELLERFSELSGDEVNPRRRGFLEKLRDLFE